MMLKEVLLLNPVYVTLFWAIVLNFYSGEKHSPKVFLGKVMLVAFIIYLSHLFYFSGQVLVYRYLDSIYTWASLLVYPLYHVYIRLLTVEKQFSFQHHSKFLLLPTIVFLLHLAGVILLTSEQHLTFIMEVIPGKQKAVDAQIYLLGVYHLSRFIFILQVFYYLYHNFRLIRFNNQNLQDYYSNTEDRKLHWVQFFNFLLAATSLASASAAFLGRETFASGEVPLAIPSLVFSLMLFFIGLAGNRQKATYISPLSNRDDKVSTGEYKNFASLKKKLAALFEKEKIFKNPDLKIWDVCTMLGTNRTYVSRVINEEYKRNFCNHVNYYRVKYAKELARENSDLSNDQIADLAGFGSQNSMQRAFQVSEGISPKQYRRQITSAPVHQPPATP